MENRVIIVAGATGGIGKRTCVRLAKEGASLVAVGADQRKLARLKEELNYDDRRIVYLRLNLRRYHDWGMVAETAMRTFGRIDVLINCVGVIVPGAFDTLSPSEIELVVNTNIVNVMYGVRCVLPAMKAQRSGHIITIGSLGSIVPMPFESLYCSTKFAVRGFCLSLREELRGTGIEVSLISPGPVETPMLRRESRSDRSTMAFIQRPLEPDAVAKAVVRTIRKPSQELLLPVQSKLAGFLMSVFPAFFTAAYPLLNLVGGLRLKRYRGRHTAAASSASLEPAYE
jgi:2-dehydro-3-deoxy-L-rhamnonate dehydrogenase (NAD+)